MRKLNLTLNDGTNVSVPDLFWPPSHLPTGHNLVALRGLQSSVVYHHGQPIGLTHPDQRELATLLFTDQSEEPVEVLAGTGCVLLMRENKKHCFIYNNRRTVELGKLVFEEVFFEEL